MLIGYGNRNLPYDVPANEFMTMSGAKASSSRGNVIWTRDVLEQYGADTLRYYLSATAPEGRDTDFTFDEMIRRNNDELVAAYGNAVHRTLTFLQSKFEGVVPQPQALRNADHEVLAEVKRGFEQVGHNIESCHFKDGLNAAMAGAVQPIATWTSRLHGSKSKRIVRQRNNHLCHAPSHQWATYTVQSIPALLIAKAAWPSRLRG